MPDHPNSRSDPCPKPCDECATALADEDAQVLKGLGRFHHECLQPCECGWLWPWSLVKSGEVVLRCSGCARRPSPLDENEECA